MRNALLSPLVVAATLLAATPSPEPSARAPSTIVHIKNFTYVPARITVTPGTIVRFVNDDDDAHTVTAADKSFDSAGMDAHDIWDHTFGGPGTYRYFCALHPYMKGSVVVMKGNAP